MAPLLIAQGVALTAGGVLAAITAAEAVRGRVPAITAAGLLVVIVSSSAGELRVLPDWSIRDAWLIGISAVLATYPDGRFVPDWTRWVVAAAAVVAVVDGVLQGGLLERAAPVLLPLLTITLLACQLHRYRRRSGVEERTRVRWPDRDSGIDS